MKNQHIIFGKSHFLFVKDIAVFHTDVIIFVEETFTLNTCHVENIQFADSIIKALNFCVWNILLLQHLNDVFRYTQFRWRNEEKTNAVITGQSFDQGMNSTAKLQVTAKTDGQVIQMTF